MTIRSRTFEGFKAVLGRWAAAFALILTAIPSTAYSQQRTEPKPNILVIMGDDIGWFNPSCYNRGMMGYQTPNIDRIANEGALYTCWYGQQSSPPVGLPLSPGNHRSGLGLPR
jgi:hypothetical protein